MIYACNKCHFLFERVGVVDDCPDCGKHAVREANEAEKAEYRKNLRERNEPDTNGGRK